MAIDPADNKTVDAFDGPQKRGRGRPSAGQAKTAAERMKAYRKRKAQQVQQNKRNGQAPAVLSVTRNVVRGLLYCLCCVDQLCTDELQRLAPDELAILLDRLGSAKMLVRDVIDKQGRAAS